MSPEGTEQTGEGTQPSAADEIEALKKALAEEKSKAEANLTGWQRAQADFINYKRYCEQEKGNIIKYANAELLCSILPALDDFERALAADQVKCAKKDWVEGMKAVVRKLRSALEVQGLTCISALGEEFDPRMHEAMASGEGKKDTVVQELQPGYRLHDRVIRPAKVIVGKGEEEGKKES